MADHDDALIEKAAKGVRALESHEADPSVEQYARAVLDAVADDLRDEAEIRWMKVAVMRDGEAIREAQEAAWNAGMAAGQAWGRRVNAIYPTNPYRKEADRG